MILIKEEILDDLKERAVLNGGVCLSKQYVNYNSPLQWRCAKGHTWEAASTVIKHGSWCPACAINNKKGSIEEMQEIAKTHGGICLSKEYTNNRSKLKWQCRLGHIWLSAAGNIKSGHWCKKCAVEKMVAPRRLTLDQMKKIALSRGGKCLSQKYLNSNRHLIWQCKNDHIWKALPSAVKKGNWCKICAGLKKSNLADIKKATKGHGGKCLSETYNNRRTKLRFQCKEGHIWDSLPYGILKGVWCSICANKNKGLKRREAHFKKIVNLIKQRRHRCLSKFKDYESNNSFIELKCLKGHKWSVLCKTIINGHGYCPIC